MLTNKLQSRYFGMDFAVQDTKQVSKTDPSNATYDEIMEIYKELLEAGKVEEGAFDFLKNNEDSGKRQDFLAELQEQKNESRDLGEMVGYRQAVQAYQALYNYKSEPKYVETESGLQKVEYRAGELKSGILGLGGCGSGLFSLRYAKNSTAQNPVVEVRIENTRGTGKETCFVDINAIDFENAAEMEMFAWLAHCEKQGLTSGHTRLYEQGRGAGIFPAENLSDFLYGKQNWTERLNMFSDSETGMLLQELMRK